MSQVGEKRLDPMFLRQEIYKSCPECEAGYWCRIDKDYPTCRECGTKVGKKYVNQTGDIYIRLAEDDPYYTMTVSLSLLGSGWVREARLVMAKKLGRCLKKNELIGHKDKSKDNNSPSNLFVIDSKKTQKHAIARSYEKKRKTGSW